MLSREGRLAGLSNWTEANRGPQRAPKREREWLGFSSRASPPHRPREDELTHPADTSRANLVVALALHEVAAFQTQELDGSVSHCLSVPPPGFAASLPADNSPQRKEAQPLSHALTSDQYNMFDSSALWPDGPEVELNWPFPYPILPPPALSSVSVGVGWMVRLKPPLCTPPSALTQRACGVASQLGLDQRFELDVTVTLRPEATGLLAAAAVTVLVDLPMPFCLMPRAVITPLSNQVMQQMSSLFLVRGQLSQPRSRSSRADAQLHARPWSGACVRPAWMRAGRADKRRTERRPQSGCSSYSSAHLLARLLSTRCPQPHLRKPPLTAQPPCRLSHSASSWRSLVRTTSDGHGRKRKHPRSTLDHTYRRVLATHLAAFTLPCRRQHTSEPPQRLSSIWTCRRRFI
jgi:hypothetical protein